MRLTLRTLLAYLDDTLEPAESRLIGEKVAESDVAPELIERIKKVTRRRGLAAPPVTGDGDDAASDPNTVAEYIDNSLPEEQIDEVEETALASDSHLAEISACHQILTLVLGEPAKVPPTARQRMYRLVKGPESIPYRRTASSNIVAGVADPDHAREENQEADEALLLGMTSTRLLVPIATAVVILLLLVGIIMLAIPSTPKRGTQGYIALDGNGRNSIDPKQNDKVDPNQVAEAKKKRDAYDQHIQRGRTAWNARNWDAAIDAFKAALAVMPGDAIATQLVKDATKAKSDVVTLDEALARARTAIKADKLDDAATALSEAIRIDASHAEVKKVIQEINEARAAIAAKKNPVPVVAELGPMPREVEAKSIVTPKDVPDPDRLPVARLFTRESLVLNRRRDTDKWERLEPQKEIHTTDTILTLPGNQAEVHFDTGVVLNLWGSLPQYQTIPVLDLQESRIVPHSPPNGFDADFTLESGRVFITRQVAKGKQVEPSKVRVRFKEEIWEITLLDAEVEVCVDLLGFYPEGVPFSKEKFGPAPKTEFYFGLLKGKAGLKVKFKDYPMLQAPMRADWDSVVGEFNVPEKITEQDMEWWNKSIPAHDGAKAMQAAVTYFVDYMKKSQASLETVFNSAMKDEKEQANYRAYAVHCLQAIDSMSFLADALDMTDLPEGFIVRAVGIRCVQHWTGQSPERDLQLYRLLIDKKGYTEPHAQMIMQLLHPFRENELAKAEIAAALFDAMRHERVAIRDLAVMHMSLADTTGFREIGFLDMAAPEQQRDPVVAKWKASYKRRVIDKKK